MDEMGSTDVDGEEEKGGRIELLYGTQASKM
jgi:hypothetical protein